MNISKWTLLVAAATLAGGCASITVSDVQSVMVTTRLQDGKPVDKAACTLRNDKGKWSVVSPGSIGVLRSADDMQVDCDKENTPKGMAKVISRAHGGMFGNIIFGGGIGAIIDHSRGTGYDYPDLIEVVMGGSIVIDRNEQRGATNQDRSSDSGPDAGGGHTPAQ